MTETDDRIGIVGAGRVGSALARRLAERGSPPVLITSRTLADAAGLANLVGAQVAATSAQVAAECQVTILAVPDSELARVADSLVELLPVGASLTGRVVAHCAGVHGTELLSPCSRIGAATGVLHPLAPIPDGDPACLEGAYASIAGDEAAVAALEAVSARLGLVSFRIDGVDRALYHAAAALAGILPVLIEQQAERAMAASGAPIQGVAGLRQLLLLAAENVRRLGPWAALSGPSTRADDDTTELHRQALAGVDAALEELYRLTLALAAEASPETHRGVPGDD
ncbi:MAG TPA: DUF2520 domain-containing protein [Candidatus Nanopelagicaceae bacterium]|nr:DUF2520 domain-containing protein [Candidatus Nanopelagicaceae bacterium]